MIERGRIHSIVYRLYEGDAMAPCSLDILVAEGRLDVGQPIPPGWRVLSGNPINSSVAIIGYRHEFDDMIARKETDG